MHGFRDAVTSIWMAFGSRGSMAVPVELAMGVRETELARALLATSTRLRSTCLGCMRTPMT
eukprot:1113960-Rhodomonas_salina.1